MRLKKLVNKIRNGTCLLKNEGFLSFGIKSLQIIQSQTQKKTDDIKLKRTINIRVKYADALLADPQKGLPDWPGTDKKSLTFNWLMPPPGKGSGGHMNIFRFIRFLEKAGHECRIYLYADGGGGSINNIYQVMDGYPEVNAKMQWLNDREDMAEADGIFATSWETAYASYNSKLNARRFYFVQDFEPYFYAIGSLYALAENSYRFGFYGVTAGGWLSNKLRLDYGMQTDHFDFGADGNVYKITNYNTRNEIFFYARPYTERRGFEMGIMALDLFHKKHPEYKINLAGWDVSDYAIPFPYVNLSTLPLNKLNDVYNRCAAGLVMSFTNMSLLPLELLSSGTIAIVNDGENNRLVSNNKYIVYTPNDPISLSDALSKVVSRNNLSKYAIEASRSVGKNTWENSGRKFVTIVERETRRRG